MSIPAAQGTIPRQRPPLSGFRVGVLALVVATAAWRWWTTSHWSWFADDWVYLDQTRSASFLEYVFQGYNSHLMPGQFLVTWTLTAFAPLEYGWAAFTLTLFAVASLLAWALALREIFGERVQLLFPLALIALSPLFLMPTVWFASGIRMLPLQLFMGLSILFLARYLLRGHRRRDMAWLTVSFALGLFFWQKALLILIPLAIVGWILLPDAPRRRTMALGRVLTIPAALGALFAGAYFATRRSGALAMPRTEFAARPVEDWWRFLSTSAQDVGLPTLVGGPFQRMTDPWDTYDPVSTTTSFVLVLVFIALVAIALVLRRHSLAAVGGLLVYATTSWGLVIASDRFLLDGSDGAGRYAADIVPVAALAIALLTTRTVLEPDGTALRHELSRGTSRAGRTALVLAASGIVATMLVVNVTTWRIAQDNSPRPWVDALVADAKRAREASLIDASAPANVIHPLVFMEYATLSRMLGPLGLPLTFEGPSELPLMPDAQGHLMQADIVNVASTNSPPPPDSCGFLVRPGRSVRIPLTADLFRYGWAVRLDYFAEQTSTITVSTDSEQVDLPLRDGLRLVNFQVTDSITSLEVSAPANAAPVCVTQVFIGGFGASNRSPWG